jgi:hypothetical protein
MLKYDDPLSA